MNPMSNHKLCELGKKVTKNPKAKGSQFERDIARRLSKWWMNDTAQDDVFWRTDSSGGRSTQRAKQGLTTKNATGDIASRCMEGDLFVKHFVVEIKRGYNKLDPLLLLDKPENKNHIFRDWWYKLDMECIREDAAWPMLIFKRDRAETCVAISEHFFETMLRHYGYTPPINWIVLDFKEALTVNAVVMNFKQFLTWLPGPLLKEYLRKNENRDSA
jgi:hypothetical protein